MWCPRCGSEYREGIERCVDDGAVLVDAEQQDPETALRDDLRQIDRDHRRQPLRSRLSGRRRLGVEDAWAAARPFPGEMIAGPANSTFGVASRLVRSVIYATLGAPEHRMAKARRFAETRSARPKER